MAKGQMRSNKEKKKPKAAHNDKKKGGAPAFGAGPGQNTPSANPFAKKNQRSNKLRRHSGAEAAVRHHTTRAARPDNGVRP
jgi:hypothetical protein